MKNDKKNIIRIFKAFIKFIVHIINKTISLKLGLKKSSHILTPLFRWDWFYFTFNFQKFYNYKNGCFSLALSYKAINWFHFESRYLNSSCLAFSILFNQILFAKLTNQFCKINSSVFFFLLQFLRPVTRVIIILHLKLKNTYNQFKIKLI